MAKTDKITLGGVEYTIHPFNIDELLELQDLTDAASTDLERRKLGLRIISLSLRRAEPKVESGKVEVQADEISPALTKVIELSGVKMEMAAANPPEAAPPAAA